MGSFHVLPPDLKRIRCYGLLAPAAQIRGQITGSAYTDKRVINGKATRREYSETLQQDLVERSLPTVASVSALER